MTIRQMCWPWAQHSFPKIPKWMSVELVSPDNNPYEVCLWQRDLGHWSFAWKILAVGLNEPAGLINVCAYPSDDQKHVFLGLYSVKGLITLQIDSDPIRRLVARIEAAWPPSAVAAYRERTYNTTAALWEAENIIANSEGDWL